MFKRIFFTVITIFLLFASVAQPAITFFKNGKTFEEKGNYGQAIIAFKKAIKLDKKLDSAYLQLGMLYAKINKADSGILILKEAIKVFPNFASVYIVTGDINRDYKKNTDDAIRAYLAALKIDSTNKVVYYSLAWCYNTKGYYREAIKYGIRSLELDNNYKIGYNELGFAYRQLKAYQECIDQFKKNLAISVSETPLLYSAFCYIELKQKENALKMYEALNKLNPKSTAGLKKKIDAMP